MTVPTPNIKKKFYIDPKNNDGKDIFLKLSIDDIQEIVSGLNYTHDRLIGMIEESKEEPDKFEPFNSSKMRIAKLIRDIDAQVGSYLPK